MCYQLHFQRRGLSHISRNDSARWEKVDALSDHLHDCRFHNLHEPFRLLQLVDSDVFRRMEMFPVRGIGRFQQNWHDSLFRQKHERRNGGKTFLKYCLLAYGLPITFGVILSIIDATPLMQESLRISMGDGRCWIKRNYSVQLYYLYAPVGLVLTLAVVIYAITGRKIYRLERKTSQEGRIQENIDECRVRYFLYFRLFIVWLITWTLEISLWANGQTVFYNMSEMVNCLHILIIITLFKWKPKVDQLHRVANR